MTPPESPAPRVCRVCGESKPLSEFPTAKSKAGQTYHRRVCRACRAVQVDAWKREHLGQYRNGRRRHYQEHRQEILERVSAWQANNRERKLASQRAWYLANQQRLLGKQRKWYEENQDKARAWHEAHKNELAAYNRNWKRENEERVLAYMEQWRSANPDRLREYARQYRQAKPEVKRLSEQRRRARKVLGSLPDPVPFEAILAMWEAQEGRCVYCKTALAGSYDIDHVVPLSRGGPHEVGNLQLLCPTCNARKHDKTHEEFVAYLQRTEGR